MKAVSFMYVRPPGYNAESAKAAEIADERKKQEQSNPSQDLSIDGASTSMYHLHMDFFIVIIFQFFAYQFMPKKEV